MNSIKSNKQTYVEVRRTGLALRVRDRDVLADELLQLLKRAPGLARRRMANELRAGLDAVDDALRTLERTGRVWKYCSRAARGRADEYWCAAGFPVEGSTSRFSAAETLAGFRAAALDVGFEVRA